MSENQDKRMTQGDDRRRPAAWELPAEFKSMEAGLASFSPRDACLDREQLMFLAGRASVESQVDTPRNAGRNPLEHKAWPAAFAAMTALAATLLAMLIAQPEVNDAPAPNFADVGNDAPTSEPLLHPPMHFKNGVLSTSDAYRHDIENVLSTVSLAASEEAASSPIDERRRSTLTPAAWRQFDIPDAMGPRENDSSHVITNQGVTS